MRRQTTGRGLIAAVAAAALVSACGSDTADAEEPAEQAAEQQDEGPDLTDEESEEEPEEDELDPVEPANPGAATELTTVPDLDWTEVEQGPDTVVEVPGAALRVTQVAQVTELEPDVAEGFGSWADAERPTPAADGEIFVVAVYTAEDPQWEPRDSTDWPDTSGEVRVGGDAVGMLGSFRFGSQTSEQGTLLLSVPEDSAPEDVVLEVETDGEYQALSLMDGTRTASDVEHIYERGTEVSVDGERWEHSFDGFAQDATIAGEVTGAFVTPYQPRGGWARPGHVHLALQVDDREVGGADSDETSITLELEDGSTVTASNDPSSLLLAFADPVWFEIPADTTELTAVVTPAAKSGANDVAFDDATVEVAVTLD